jgi:hypothetical protein
MLTKSFIAVELYSGRVPTDNTLVCCAMRSLPINIAVARCNVAPLVIKVAVIIIHARPCGEQQVTYHPLGPCPWSRRWTWSDDLNNTSQRSEPFMKTVPDRNVQAAEFGTT